MTQVFEANPEQRTILRRVTSSLVDVVVAHKQPGYTSHRSTCPDGQFWLPVSGTQLVQAGKGQRRQQPFELLYYAPREPAVRVTDAPTLAYGVRLMLSKTAEGERDESWVQGREITWDTQRMVIGLILAALQTNPDPHTLDEAVAQWISRPESAKPETARAKWLTDVKDLLHDEPTLTLVDLGRKIDIAPAYLSAQFSLQCGQTLSQYRRQIMVQRTLVSASHSTLNVAAIEAGFYDASHFHRACLSELNVKPSALKHLIWPT